VRTRDEAGSESAWSEPAVFQTGALAPSDWQAQWITMPDPSWSPTTVLLVKGTINEGRHVDSRLYWGMYLRGAFTVPEAPVRAQACVSGLGYGDLLLNGTRVGDHRLDPGQTEYGKAALYASHDVTSLVRVGANVAQIVLGNGRYVEAYGFGPPKAFLQLAMEFADGRRETVVTDASWRCSHGPIRQNGIYEGEHVDAREDLGAWGEAGFDDARWRPARRVEGHPLVSQMMPPIRMRTERAARGLSNPRPGVFVFDFGQNLSGVVRLSARGPRGTAVQLRFAELVDPDGNLNLGTNREAVACDTFVLAGTGDEVFEPRFTYHGFRYAEVTGLPGVPSIDDAVAVVVHTDVEQTGAFLCSERLVNRIHENVLWGQRSNLMSAPTDCPQRGERMGWLGDAQLASEQAVLNFDMAAFYVKYLEDIARAQAPDGSLSDVVPPYWPLYPADPAWGSAFVTLAWTMWQRYGDLEAIERHVEGMRRYVDFLHASCEGGIVRTLGRYGDWCPPASTFPKKTPMALTSTWYAYHDTLRFSQIAGALGRRTDEKAYGERAAALRDAFNREFLVEGGRYATLPMSPLDRQPGQTSQALPLALGMVPDDRHGEAVTKLLEAVEKIADCHVDTGIVGSRYLLEVLRDTGHAETAWKVVTQTSYPGWGYMVAEGATTVWERWEKLAGQGMNSHNHIMFGTVDAWFYRTLAGIVPVEPGWRRVRVQPWPVGSLSHAGAEVGTIHGALGVRWQRTTGRFALELEVPVGVIVELHLPAAEGARTLTEGGVPVWGPHARSVSGVGAVSADDAWLQTVVQSGSYRFEVSA
jgi:alpha-L-rhamnosidase